MFILINIKCSRLSFERFFFDIGLTVFSALTHTDLIVGFGLLDLILFIGILFIEFFLLLFFHDKGRSCNIFGFSEHKYFIDHDES